MKNTDIAYIAGLIDGEGYIGIKKSTIRKDCFNPSYHARIQIRMVDEEAIKFITKTLGGNYYKEKPSVAKGRPLYCFQASDKSAEMILKTILPYLKIKKSLAEIVLKFRSIQANSVKYRNKVTGYREFPNSHGVVRKVPNLSYSDEYMEICEGYYNTCKQFNHVGIE